jgi:hypothetical protein
MPDNPVVVIVYVVLGGIVGVWAFFRCPLPAMFVNYPSLILSNVVKFIPALAVLLGAQTTIQQEPIRKPDEHLASQAQSPDTVQEATNTIEAVQVSAMPVQVNVYDTVSIGLKDKGWVQFAAASQPVPLPLMTASNGDDEGTNSNAAEGS